jgi:hypothetical protein
MVLVRENELQSRLLSKLNQRTRQHRRINVQFDLLLRRRGTSHGHAGNPNRRPS